MPRWKHVTTLPLSRLLPPLVYMLPGQMDGGENPAAWHRRLKLFSTVRLSINYRRPEPQPQPQCVWTAGRRFWNVRALRQHHLTHSFMLLIEALLLLLLCCLIVGLQERAVPENHTFWAGACELKNTSLETLGGRGEQMLSEPCYSGGQ